MFNVMKRDGKIVDFDLDKIKKAITKAFVSMEKLYTPDIIDALAIRVVGDFKPRHGEDPTITVEEIQDSVEKTLCVNGYPDVAKAYILYRKTREKVRNVGDTVVNYKEIVDNYLKINDWRVKENSTVTYSVGGLILSNSGAITANYWLSEIYDEEIAEAHRSAAMHIHDLSMLTGYCAGWSLKQLIQEGLGGVPGKITSSPASHLSTLCNQMVNFLGIMQNEWAGAQAFSSFDTYLAPFVKVDHLTQKEVKQCIQSFVYGVNTPSRWGCVDQDTEVLTIDGFKRYDELNRGDMIYTWNEGNLELNPVREIIVKSHQGEMHRYTGRHYNQTVSPEHRVLLKIANTDRCVIMHSADLIKADLEYDMPTNFTDSDLAPMRLSDDSIIEAAHHHNEIDKAMCRSMSMRQAELFVKEWYEHNCEEFKPCCSCANDEVADRLQQIALMAGYTSEKLSKDGMTFVVLNTAAFTHVNGEVIENYDGTVWCPNVENGTAVFRKDGCVYISGNCQAPFSNITLDWTVPADMKDMPAIVGGKNMDFTYGDCVEEMRMINKAFIEIMIEGDANGRGFQYPIPTYSITRDFDWSETENNKLLFEMTAKYGTPYFSNYVNSDMEPSDVRSMCCRLRLDLRELRKKSGGFFGSGESTGSIGVVTINLPHIAYLAIDEADFYERLDKLMDIAARSLKIKREVITKLLDAGLYPYTKRYLGTFSNHFSTIGLIGMNEVGLNANWLRKDLTHPETQAFAKDVLNHMRERLSDYQEKYGDLYNLEATPAESTTYRFAKHDKEKYPDIITANENGTPYYTNSSHLPVDYTEDIFSALDIQDQLQTLYTSGTVFHAFLGEKLPNWKATADLVRTIAENYKLPYYTMSPTYSVCKEHGYLAGEQKVCPICGEPTEVYSRITGYYRPVQNWNDGKTQEYKDRKTYNLGHSHLCHHGPETMKDSEDVKVPDPEVAEEPHALLFTTSTCPNCAIAKELLNKAGIKYDVIVADKSPEMAKEYKIMQAPTLVIDGKHYRGVGPINGYIQSLN